MTTTEKTAAIRKQFKAEGIKASCRMNSAGNIVVRVRQGSLARATQIAKAHENIDRDFATGEILCGGNTFVDVEWDRDIVRLIASEIRAKFIKIANLEMNEAMTVDGYSVSKIGPYEFVVRVDGAKVANSWGWENTIESIAKLMLEEGKGLN